MTSYYQWVRFKAGIEWPSFDFADDDWLIVEIYDSGDVGLMGVEYTMRQSDVAEWGEVLPRPENETFAKQESRCDK